MGGRAQKPGAARKKKGGEDGVPATLTAEATSTETVAVRR